MSRVFFFEQVPHDVSSCKAFGEPVYLYCKRPDIFDMDMVEDISKALRQYRFDPDKDFIALTGQLNQVCLLVIAVVEEWDNLSILLFDARTSRYKEIVSNPV